MFLHASNAPNEEAANLIGVAYEMNQENTIYWFHNKSTFSANDHQTTTYKADTIQIINFVYMKHCLKLSVSPSYIQALHKLNIGTIIGLWNKIYIFMQACLDFPPIITVMNIMDKMEVSGLCRSVCAVFLVERLPRNIVLVSVKLGIAKITG